ncbi:acyltransferase family protein [Nitrincola iocasae]|uniref:Acyltransferase n=1 Tax=Nitrincola iocasae TaxID=2614693 RepID=A0A5J6LCN3_9GAMM|nr:acyltransferase [Nitrincola iocasae]QEW06260.1 acyltransferase [Nitrincola iocasae]
MNTSTASEPVKLKVYYPYYDYVRFIAASVVMFGHANFITWRPAGAIAVDVFFALSGWLIGNILLNTKKEQLPQFYFNRVIRIWIPYFISFSILLLVALLKDNITLKWLEIVMYKATFVYNIFGPDQLAEYKNLMPLDGTGNHFWSVNAEEQFYLFAPILLVLIPLLGRRILVWFLLATAALIYDIYAPIFIGVLLALILKKHDGVEKNIFFKITCGLLFIAGVSLFILNMYMDTASALFSASIVMLLKIPGNPHQIGLFLGGISYSLYLNHWLGEFIANFVVKHTFITNISIRNLISFSSAYIIASIIYIIIEKYCIKMRPLWYTPIYGKYSIIAAYGTVTLGLFIGIYLTKTIG